MAKIAHITPHYGSYGTNGYDCFAVGYATFHARTMKEAKDWAAARGLEVVRT